MLQDFCSQVHPDSVRHKIMGRGKKRGEGRVGLRSGGKRKGRG